LGRDNSTLSPLLSNATYLAGKITPRVKQGHTRLKHSGKYTSHNTQQHITSERNYALVQVILSLVQLDEEKNEMACLLDLLAT